MAVCHPQSDSGSLGDAPDAPFAAGNRHRLVSHRAGENGAYEYSLIFCVPCSSPTREPNEFVHVIGGAKVLGKPIAATEILRRPNHGELHEVLSILRENQIGWYFWELMIGVNQTCFQWPDAPAAPADIFFQGVLYPNGTPYRQDEADLLHSYAQVSVL